MLAKNEMHLAPHPVSSCGGCARRQNALATVAASGAWPSSNSPAPADWKERCPEPLRPPELPPPPPPRNAAGSRTQGTVSLGVSGEVSGEVE